LVTTGVGAVVGGAAPMKMLPYTSMGVPAPMICSASGRDPQHDMAFAVLMVS
jgi:hypothetical protein